mmetsp:Transcript_39263/g.70427  ORF Transcript_39263/g.70427 Transcript_39263/m.70427 type:complete len:152 (-) Transcript_39263:47-502(-)
MSYGPAWPNLKQAVAGMKTIVQLAKEGRLPPLQEPEAGPSPDPVPEPHRPHRVKVHRKITHVAHPHSHEAHAKQPGWTCTECFKDNEGSRHWCNTCGLEKPSDEELAALEEAEAHHAAIKIQARFRGHKVRVHRKPTHVRHHQHHLHPNPG